MKEIYFSDVWYWFLLIAALCYIIGCFNFAVLISRLEKKDIRSQGSGNPGTMNMTRTFGLKIGAINFFCDVVKGGLPAVVCWLIFKDTVFAGTAFLVSDFARYFAGFFVILGHIFPFYMRFKGGKGIASAMGLFAFALPCDTWWYFFIAVVFLFGILFYIVFTEWGSMGSLMGVSGLSVFQYGVFAERYSGSLATPWVISLSMLLLAINLLTWVSHRKNVFKLLAGEEHRTSVRKRKKT